MRVPNISENGNETFPKFSRSQNIPGLKLRAFAYIKSGRKPKNELFSAESYEKTAGNSDLRRRPNFSFVG